MIVSPELISSSSIPMEMVSLCRWWGQIVAQIHLGILSISKNSKGEDTLFLHHEQNSHLAYETEFSMSSSPGEWVENRKSSYEENHSQGNRKKHSFFVSMSSIGADHSNERNRIAYIDIISYFLYHTIMVNAPTSTHKKTVIDHEFQKKYPPGTTLELFIEGRSTAYVCKIDSYFVDHEEKITVWVTLIDLKSEKVRNVFLAMDSHGNIGVYSPEHRKNAIVTQIVLPENRAHDTVKEHGWKVHGVVHGKRHAEEHV